jgi:hypothetical protein
MIKREFWHTDEIYECCNVHIVAIHGVKHDLVLHFVAQLRQLERTLGELVEDQYWISLLRMLKRYRYNIASIPLSLNHPACIPRGLMELISHADRTCRHVYPAFADNVAKIARIVNDLTTSRVAPLLDGAKSLLNTTRGKTSALVLMSTIDVAIRKEIRAQLKDHELEIITYSGLLSTGVFDNLLFVGSLGWFPESARSAPRCRKLMSVKFEWLSDGRPLAPSFISTDNLQALFRAQKLEYLSLQSRPADEVVSPEEVAPPVNWTEVREEITRQNDSADTEEQISGRFLMLNGSIALIVDASQGAKVHVIQAASQTRLLRVPVEDLEVGMYLLVRTGGGGDLVAEVADTILKDRAEDVLRMQDSWKSKLTGQVRSRGEHAVLQDLEGMGCKRATSYNLRNWMSSKSIRPQFDDDFLSVLILCGLGHEDDFIANAKLLDRVHRVAGFLIRRKLLSMVRKADITLMARQGVMEFQLPEARGGSFTAYRIDEIAPKPQSVPVGIIGQTYSVALAYG